MRGLQLSEVPTSYFDIRSRSGPGSCIPSLGRGTHSSGKGVSRATASGPLILRNRRCDPSVPCAMGRIAERFVKSFWGCMTHLCCRSYIRRPNSKTAGAPLQKTPQQTEARPAEAPSPDGASAFSLQHKLIPYWYTVKHVHSSNISIYIYIYTLNHIYMCVSICRKIIMYVYTYIYINTPSYVRTYIYMYICVFHLRCVGSIKTAMTNDPVKASFTKPRPG